MCFFPTNLGSGMKIEIRNNLLVKSDHAQKIMIGNRQSADDQLKGEKR